MKRLIRYSRPRVLAVAIALSITAFLAGGTVGVAAPVAPQPSPAANPQAAVALELWAATGSVTMPDSTVIPIWGFTDDGAGQPAEFHGPVLYVNEGDDVTIVLHNDLTENVSILFPGQDIPPDFVGVAQGETVSYSFTAGKPGTYLYESGVSSRQVQMGLYGALIVRPSLGAGYAYNDADTAFDVEAVLVLSELDPALNANPAGFDMLDYAPLYFLINGEAYPDTGEVLAEPGERVLFRYLNAGSINHTMAILGLYQSVIGHDGFQLNYAFDTFSHTVVSGETYDLIATVPAGAAVDTQYPLYVRSRAMHTYSGDAFPGGMLTYVVVE